MIQAHTIQQKSLAHTLLNTVSVVPSKAMTSRSMISDHFLESFPHLPRYKRWHCLKTIPSLPFHRIQFFSAWIPDEEKQSDYANCKHGIMAVISGNNEGIPLLLSKHRGVRCLG